MTEIGSAEFVMFNAIALAICIAAVVVIGSMSRNRKG